MGIRIEWDDTKGRFYWMPLEKVRAPTISCRYHAGMYGFDSISNILPKLTEEFTDYPDREITNATKLNPFRKSLRPAGSCYLIANPSFWIVCRKEGGKWVQKKRFSST